MQFSSRMKVGQSRYKAAYGVIHWWLKRRWARLAVITAIEVRYDALRYTGGSAQQQAAAAHEKAQVQDEWRDQGAYFQRVAEASAPSSQDFRESGSPYWLV